MSTFNENVKRLADILTVSEHIGKRKAKTGRFNTTTGTVEAGLSDLPNRNMIWVRFSDYNAAIPAWNLNKTVKQDALDVFVWVKPDPAGEFEVVGVVNSNLQDQYGDSGIPAIQPNTVISDNSIVPKRTIDILRPTITGNDLTVTVSAYLSQYGNFSGGAKDFTSELPTTANVRVWAVLYLDRSTNTLKVVKGAELAPAAAVRARIADVVVPDNGIAIAAVSLYNGQTKITPSEFVDIRGFLNIDGTGIKNNFSASAAPTVNEDTDDGYSIGSLWVDGTNAYIALDVSSGAAVWARLDNRDFNQTSSDPTSTDDGYEIGAVWVNTTDDKAFICVDNTASNAVWLDLSAVYAPTDATYIVQTASGDLANEQALASLATGLMKNTTSTGVVSIADGSDLNDTFGSQGQHQVYASPTGTNGLPGFRLLVVDDIPNLPAARITSGQFDTARIPDLAASKITSGTFDNTLINWASPDAIGTTSRSTAKFTLLSVLNDPESGQALLQLGHNRSADGQAAVHLISTASGTPTFNLRLFRFAGANGESRLQHTGTGDLSFIANDNAQIVFRANGSLRAKWDTSGVLRNYSDIRASPSTTSDARLVLSTDGSDTDHFIIRAFSSGNLVMENEPANPFIAISNDIFVLRSGGNNNALTLDNNQNARIFEDLQVDGALSKGSGSFKIDHPLKPETHFLVHSFVEAPKGDLIYRGSVRLTDGTARVVIDDVAQMERGTFAALTRDVQVWLQSKQWDKVRGRVTDNGVLFIECEDKTSNALVDWLVIAERNDTHWHDSSLTDNSVLVVEPEKPDMVFDDPDDMTIRKGEYLHQRRKRHAWDWLDDPFPEDDLPLHVQQNLELVKKAYVVNYD